MIEDEIIAQFPRTYLVIAGIDPLKDGYIQFFHQLLKNKVTAAAIEMELMPHGFLGMYYPLNKGMNEAMVCVKRVGEEMKKMLAEV